MKPVYYAAKENPMFSLEQTALVRFVTYPKPVECALCKRKSKTHWTTLVPFRALDMDNQPNPFVLDTKVGLLLMPLTPVCRDHILAEDTTAMEQMQLAFRYFYDMASKRLKEDVR